MKKVIIFAVVVIALFATLGIVTKLQNEQASEGNPYGKDTLFQETIDQLDDPNYQNIITPSDLEKEIKSGDPVTVYFYSPTCGYCKKTSPIAVPLAKDMDIDLKQFNLLEFPDGWDKYGIETTPTFVQFKDGKEVSRYDKGYTSEEEYRAWFEEQKK